MPLPNTLSAPPYTLTDITNLNLIVGRNGSGKSRFLRGINDSYLNNANFRLTYLSPERAGVFEVQSGIEDNIRSNPAWVRSVRNKNQGEQFKQMSAQYLRQLETQFHRRMESDMALRKDVTKNFRTLYLGKIDEMLMNVVVAPKPLGASGFDFENADGAKVTADSLSSGEAEIIALGAEVLFFFATRTPSVTNLLLLDEPDVHLHPDLQARFARFLIGELNELDAAGRETTAVVIATHSTPLICALGTSALTSVGTKYFLKDEVNQRPMNPALGKSLPFFGHPLSLAINNDPLVIMEGEDDERVWAQAARTSGGRIRLFPCLSESVDQQTELEQFCAKMLEALYDTPIGFSIRDGDGKGGGELDPIGSIRRFRLECYAIENALLTDECLGLLKSSWQDFCDKAKAWLEVNAHHPNADDLNKLACSKDRHRHTKIKAVRLLIGAVLQSTKPWEVIVGQAIGRLEGAPPTNAAPDSLANYLGVPLLSALGVFTAATGPAA